MRGTVLDPVAANETTSTMKTLITALALAALIAVPAFAQSAAAAPKARRDSDQPRAHRSNCGK
jgi:hypothetical protein